jgi:chaperone modulatory protein CbpM
MSIESAPALPLDDDGVISMSQLIELSGLSEGELRALVECGALEPVDETGGSRIFSAHCVVVARTAYRLREDFALDDTHSLAVVLRLAQRVAALERRIEELRART